MKSPRKIAYVTGTRADFGLMASTLDMLHASSQFELSIVVTGTHLSQKYGNTVEEIERLRLPILARLELDESVATGATMAKNIGKMVIGFVEIFSDYRPDVVLLLGDRGEMLAAAIAALHLNIFIAHIHGGERSGTIDEPVRHAISKLCHYHLVATIESKERLTKMGEMEDAVVVVGAPGLDGLIELASQQKKSDLFKRYDLLENVPLALVVFHPVMQEEEIAGEQISEILRVLSDRDLQVLALEPNSDAGRDLVFEALDFAADKGYLKLIKHLPRRDFAGFLKYCDLLVGNSSSGIIEAASFGTRVLNVGSRQHMRQRSANVLDADIDVASLSVKLDLLLNTPRKPIVNVYGDGKAGSRIVAALRDIDLKTFDLAKINAY